MAFDAGLSAINGMAQGVILESARRMEDSVRAGRSATLIAVTQFSQVSQAMQYIDRALKAIGSALPNFGVHTAFYLAPPLLAFAATYGIENETLRNAVLFAQEHLGTLCQIAATVSSVAIACFGDIYFGVASCVVLGLGFLDRLGLLPTEVRQIMHECTFPLSVGAGLFFGSVFARIFAAVNLALYGFQWYITPAAPQAAPQAAVALAPSASSIPEHGLNAAQLEDILLNGVQDVSINKDYVAISTLPPIPDVDITQLVTKLNAVTHWDRHVGMLRTKLKSDARFMQLHGNPDSKSDEMIVKYVKDSFNAFITSIVERRVLAGEPRDYERLHNYLRIITRGINQERDEVSKVDMLVRLAVEGGEYCGPGKFEVTESIYAAMTEGGTEISLRIKVLNALQSDRNAKMQGMYSEVMKIMQEGADLQIPPHFGIFDRIILTLGSGYFKLYRFLFDLQDVHYYNAFLNFYGHEFGLRKAGADNDSLAVRQPAMQLAIDYTAMSLFRDFFWQSHNMQSTVKLIQDSIGTARMPKPEIYEWWRQWIERQDIEASAKNALRDEFEGFQTIYGRRLENYEHKIKDEFVLAMLFDMGVFHKRPVESSE